jgi:hypothetical protein
MYKNTEWSNPEKVDAVECPKCYSQSAWLKREGPDTVLRCLCGLYRVVASTLETITIEKVAPENEATLPRRGTKLWDCLTVLAGLAPARTDEITVGVNAARSDEQSLSDIASQLTVLRYKRLVVALDSRKGHAGGSTWELTPRSRTLLLGKAA